MAEETIDGYRDEIAEKSIYWISGVVDVRLRETFGSDDVHRAAVMLAGLAPAPDCAPDADEAACRLMLAAIRVSRCDLVRLRMWIDAGRMDPRDLIAAAEYPLQIAADGDDALAIADLDDYLAWASGSQHIQRGSDTIHE